MNLEVLKKKGVTAGQAEESMTAEEIEQKRREIFKKVRED